MPVEFRKDNRGGRVFLDWMRNHPGSTSVCAWSLRPRPTAPAAVPLAWEELDEVAPDAVSIRDISDRLAQPDPLADAIADPTDAESAITALEHMLDDAAIHPAPFDRFRS